MLENALTINGWRKDLYIGDKLNRLKIPVRFIWGNKDAFEKPETGMEKAKNMTDYKFEVVENAGHCVWIDQRDKCVALVMKMLKEVNVEVPESV